MTIKIASCSLEELFAVRPIQSECGSEVAGALRLPEYQRPYRWGRTQLQRLLDDLQKHFARTQPEHDFYLGSVILHQANPGQASPCDHLNIIDGQQRLTTMALIALWLERGTIPSLYYRSPISQRRIRANFRWLREQARHLEAFRLAKINVTLVVTDNEDEAYRFFETHNTAGVRLAGKDIIKAYHLQAAPSGKQQDHYARAWERLGDLDPLFDAVLKARCWQALGFRAMPRHTDFSKIKALIVSELAEATGTRKSDVSYHLIPLDHDGFDNTTIRLRTDSYGIRQPLNAGVNTINYIRYFQSLYQRIQGNGELWNQAPYTRFYHELICTLPGCAYLKKLYDSCLLTYASHFGTPGLYEAALWLFRVVYAPRVQNKRMVKEASVQKFVRDDCWVYERILSSYTHEQCIERLQEIEIKPSPDNLEPESRDNVKKRFVRNVNARFKCGLDFNQNPADAYDPALRKAITKELDEGRGNSG